MRLRTLAGAYAGQVRDYSTATGLAALRTGMAERVDAPPSVVRTHAAAVSAPKPTARGPAARTPRRTK
jgi:hypothetical protein